MTLHITTMTPKHIISASDRLIATSAGYRELDADLYKHLILITNDARMTIGFAGFAGLSSSPNQTMDWLTNVINSTASDGFHTFKRHLRNIAIAVKDYVGPFRQQGVQAEALRLAIQACGWVGTKEYGEIRYDCVIDNCIDRRWTWTPTARSKFTMREKHYFGSKSQNTYYISYLGNGRLGLKQRAQLRILRSYAGEENPKKVFQSSVNVIRAAASISNGTIGYNCSGIRNSKGDPAIEVFDDRDTTVYDVVMPNIIKSTSLISMSVTDMKGKRQ